MKNDNLINKEINITEVLDKFLQKEDIKEFLSKYKIDFNAAQNLSESLNLLITFVSKKLHTPRFYEFLFQLANASTQCGEPLISISIYKTLLSLIKWDQHLTELRARGYLELAAAYSQIAEWGLSLKFAKAAEKNYKVMKKFLGLAKVENLYGIIAGDQGDVINAQKHFEVSLAYLNREEDLNLRGKLLTNLGIIENILGNFGNAISYYEEAVANFEGNHDFDRAAEIKHNLGMLYLKKQDYKCAMNKFDESISDSLKSKQLQHLGISYLSKAEVYIHLSEFTIADSFAKKALEISTKIKDRLTIADSYKVIGIIQRNKFNFESAENYLLTSMRINVELGNKLNQAETAYELGVLYKDIRKNEESKKYFHEALTFYKKINAYHEVKEIKNYLPN